MTTLTRTQAKAALTLGGWPAYLLDIMVAVGAQESSLRVEVVGPKNSDGTEDLGWLQINSRYVTAGPLFDRARLLSDPAYNARCGKRIFDSQGLKAWVAYTTGDFAKFMPPHLGGPPLVQGGPAWFLNADLQNALNNLGYTDHEGKPLVVDGAFGKRTAAALKKWQMAEPPLMDGTARAADSIRLIP